MRAHEFITEHVVNLLDKQQKTVYSNKVWELLQQAYSTVPGGFQSAASPQELVNDSGLWKLVTRNGEITAVNIYKDKYGRKSIAVGTNGTDQGRNDYRMIKSEDLRLGRSWSEVSGAVEKTMAKAGAQPIPSKFAHALTGKKILDYDEDGFHYTRLIGGEPHSKVIYGTVILTPELAQELKSQGIELHDLPSNFKR